MDSQMGRPQHGSPYDHEPYNASLHSGEGGDEHQRDKKSVLKKVKAKAKKLKDTLKLYGHGPHDEQDQLHHDRDQGPDDHDLDEEDEEDEDEEMADDPEIHGTQGFGSATIRNSVPEQVEKSGDMRTNYGSSTAMKNQEDSSGYSEAKVTDSLRSFDPVPEDKGIKVGVDRTAQVPQSPLNTPAPVTSATTDQPKVTNPIQGFAQEQVSIRGQPQIDLEHSPRFEEDLEAPKNRPQDHKTSNYETKVSDPTGEGSKEAEVSSILHSLDKMNLSGESKQKAAENLHSEQRDVSIFPTGIHNQFSSEPTPPIPVSSQESPQFVSEISNASKFEYHPHNDTTEKAPEHSSYPEEISSLKQKPAENFYTEQCDVSIFSTKSHDQFSSKPTPPISISFQKNSQSVSKIPNGSKFENRPYNDTIEKAPKESNYMEEISFSKQKVAENLHTEQRDMSIFSTGSGNQFSSESTPPIPISSQESSQSISEISNTSKFEDHPQNDMTDKAPKQNSYMEKISSATSAIADKAISAKNVLVSKLGYGEKDNTKEREIQEEKAKPASPVAYGKRIASTVTQKLTPVYGQVAEKGSNLISKTPGAATNNGGQDKGVSVKDYLAKKLKPGEEHRALSEVISERLHKQKNETDKKSGKVMESEEVKRQLGSVEENSEERVDQGSVHVPEIGVVNKIKGMVGSYFGKGTEPHSSSQQSHGSSSGTEGFSTSEEDQGERRLQESGN